MTAPCCLVVGIGPGLGLALVRKFAREGYRVAFVGRRQAALDAYAETLTAEGLEVRGFAADAGDPDSMAAAVAAIRAAYGDPEVLIYNAAIVEPARFATVSPHKEIRYSPKVAWPPRREPAGFDYFVSAFRTNVAGALHAAQLVLPGMRARGEGTILLTGGVLAFDPWIEWGVTACGKAALRSLGISLAKELKPEDIHVVTIAIHGTMEEGTPYDPALVADAYWALHREPREAWQPELHFKPAGGHERDPDAGE